MRIALIHALAQSIHPIQASFARIWPEVTLMNLLDDSLSRDVERDGRITDATTRRFLDLTGYAVSNGADGVLFTCSAFGPCIDRCKEAFPAIPVLKPNEAMIEEAIAAGGKIALLATFAPTLKTMPPEFTAASPQIEVVPRLVETALGALEGGEAERHDALVAETARTLPPDCDVVALAQFSMARAAPAVAAVAGKPVLTTPDSATRKLKRLLTA